MKSTRLSNGLWALVDDCDFNYLLRWSWHYQQHEHNRTGYAQAYDPHDGTIKMHRVIAVQMGLDITGLQVDHKDRNGLHNWRSNLRVVTQTVNKLNVDPYANNWSGVKGVGWHQAAGKWYAKITVNNKQMRLGLFTDFNDAVAARAAAELRYT